MIFTPASLVSLLAVVPAVVQAIPVFSHSDGIAARQASNLQTQLSVDPGQVATGSQQDGQGADVADNQVRSLTSFNNFANFCLTQNVPITDGLQIKGGSCCPTIMGVIASTNNMPRCKFEFPANGETIKANEPFTLRMKIDKLTTGNFVNPNSNYYGAPQTTGNDGNIIGHSHVTIQKMDDVTSPLPLDPSIFAFFKGFNALAKGGVLTADVPAPGLPKGFYRMCSINTSANHQPTLVAVAQHGSLDDCTYFQAGDAASKDPFFNNLGGKTAGVGAGAGAGAGAGNNNGKGGDKAAASTTAAAAPAVTSAAAAGGNKGQDQGKNGQANNGQGNNNNNKGQAAQQAADQAKQAADAKKAAEDQKKATDAAKAAGGANGNKQGAQQAADKAKQEADAKKAAEDAKKAADAAKAAGGANGNKQGAQQAADKAKQEADAKKAAEDQKKAQQQSNGKQGGGKKNGRRSLRFQRD